MKTYDSLEQATIRLAGSEEENRHSLVGTRGFADDVVQIFFRDYHMHDFPRECLQELRMEFVNVEKDTIVITLSVNEQGHLALMIK